MHLLALDIATSTGWAHWQKGHVEHFGARRFMGDLGQFADEFDRWLTGVIRKESITEIAVEAPIPMRGPTNMDTTKRLIGAYAIAHKLGHRRRIPVMDVGVGQWRSYFLGHPHAPRDVPKAKRRAWLKRAAIEECRKRGWVVKSDDAADALGLLSYFRSLRESDSEFTAAVAA